jgi:hypothetical protein
MIRATRQSRVLSITRRRLMVAAPPKLKRHDIAMRVLCLLQAASVAEWRCSVNRMCTRQGAHASPLLHCKSCGINPICHTSSASCWVAAAASQK